MLMDTKNHSWHNVQGEKLNVPVSKEHADKKTLVIDTGNLWSVRGTTRLDPQGYPHITLYLRKHMGLKHGGPKQLAYYRWTGEEWTGGISKGIPENTEGDKLISSANKIKLLLGTKGEVAWWHSSNGGESFTKGDALLKDKRTRFSVSSIIRNAHPDARVIVAGNNAADKNLYREMYLLGDHGAIKRLATDAKQTGHLE